ncbi:MAG: trypsin-like peptidase domain-containing protein [Candidatus Omnitrophota bacterium]
MNPSLKSIALFSAGLLLMAGADAASSYERRTPIVQAVEKVLPAVVDISTTKDVKALFSTPFDELFEKIYRLQGLGSGVVVEGGYIVTNNHVVKYDYGYADKIFITFYEGNRQLEAAIIGVDPRADVAILQIKGEPPAKFLAWGRSDDLMIGETVIALGNALGQSFTVTDGIISALNRTIEDKEGSRLNTLIQTNADINQGNSGGPLVNINGDFIGLNTAIISPSGGSVGLGFAIPISRVKQVYDYWINHIPSLEDRLGIEIQDMNAPLKHFFQSNYPSLKNEPLDGVVTLKTSPDGLCAGKLARRDIICSVDGNNFKDSKEFIANLEAHQGKKLTLGIIRDGKKSTCELSIPDKNIEIVSWLGMELQKIDNPWRRWCDYQDNQQGLVVLSVKEGSQAQKAEIQRGDILIAVNMTYVSTLEQLNEARKSLRRVDFVLIDVISRVDKKIRRYRLRTDSI